MFTEEHKIFRQGLRDFLDREVMPNIDQWEKEQRMPKDLWPKFGEMGYFGFELPREIRGDGCRFHVFGHFYGRDRQVRKRWFYDTSCGAELYVIAIHIQSTDLSFLKEKYLTKVISGEWIACIGITEPGAGSDVANIQAKAIMEDGHYVVNGSKTFITNGVYGDFVVAVVKTNPDLGAAGVSLLVIDLNSEGVVEKQIE